VEVRDDGPAAGGAVPPPVRAASGGKGLVGMRERVILFGGELEAGPSTHGGYRVAAPSPGGHGMTKSRVLLAEDQALLRHPS
jgi:hypothetical protein